MKRNLALIIVVAVCAVLALGIWVVKIKEPVTPLPASSNDALSMRLGDKKSVDGFELELIAINDSRCQPGVVCIWEGEIGATVKYTNPDLVPGGYMEFLNLGTRTRPIVRLPYAEYQVQILDSSSGDRADLLVTKFEINTFFDCTDAGYPVVRNSVASALACTTPDGRIFAEPLSNAAEKFGLIELSSPQPGAMIAAPQISVSGKARGIWYFEASFPVQLTDGTGNELCSSPAQAQSDWMTEEFVPFNVVLPCNEVVMPAYGYLLLKKDNPSGLPENEDQLKVLVKLRKDASEL